MKDTTKAEILKRTTELTKELQDFKENKLKPFVEFMTAMDFEELMKVTEANPEMEVAERELSAMYQTFFEF